MYLVFNSNFMLPDDIEEIWRDLSGQGGSCVC